VLAVDGTGVGRAVVDLFRRQGPIVPVTITWSGPVQQDGCGFFRVPKRELAGTLQLLFQTGRLSVPKGLPLRDTLVKELLAFRVKVKPETGNESFEALRERDHDDLVLATALAAWVGEKLLAGEVKAAKEVQARNDAGPKAVPRVVL
jgi:hypothetical protein